MIKPFGGEGKFNADTHSHSHFAEQRAKKKGRKGGYWSEEKEREGGRKRERERENKGKAREKET